MNQDNDASNQYNTGECNHAMESQRANCSIQQNNFPNRQIADMNWSDKEVNNVSFLFFKKTQSMKLSMDDYEIIAEGVIKYLKKKGNPLPEGCIRITPTDRRKFKDVISKLSQYLNLIHEALEDDLILYEILINMKNREDSNRERHHNDKLKALNNHITRLAWSIGKEELSNNGLPFLTLHTSPVRTLPAFKSLYRKNNERPLPPQINTNYLRSFQANQTIGNPQNVVPIINFENNQDLFYGIEPPIFIPGIAPDVTQPSISPSRNEIQVPPPINNQEEKNNVADNKHEATIQQNTQNNEQEPINQEIIEEEPKDAGFFYDDGFEWM